MARSLAVLAALAVLALVACGGSDDPSSQAGPSDKLSAPLSYARSGRDGERREVTVQPDGSGTLSVAGGSEPGQAAFTLEPEELKRLAELASEADLSSVDSPDLDPEANHTFALTYGDSEVRWDEEQRPEGLEQLTSRLFDVLEKYRD
jgi:hypothetical protein